MITFCLYIVLNKWLLLANDEKYKNLWFYYLVATNK